MKTQALMEIAVHNSHCGAKSTKKNFSSGVWNRKIIQKIPKPVWAKPASEKNMEE